jgi:starch synthase (maltosyl-transferring)
VNKPPVSRVVIEQVQPSVDGGRFPVKRTQGEWVSVSADIYTDGHDTLAAGLKVRGPGPDSQWTEIPMRALPNDAWMAEFQVADVGIYEFTIEAWIDRFTSWRKELEKKVQAKQDVTSELLEGAALITAAADGAKPQDANLLNTQASLLKKGAAGPRIATALDSQLAEVMARWPDRSASARLEKPFQVLVERERARYGAWYEMFPRSTGKDPARSASFKDAEKRLRDIADMGFDVLYLPPIHPIGKSFRKGPNNAETVGPQDPGSPWAIGSPEGGHTAVHPELGTLADFDHFVAAAKKLHLEVALDIAFQCSPDHPYVREHPEWFRHRPDGTIKYAENPPKKYQDIYPLDFDGPHAQALWDELRDVVLFWADRGIAIFRVDNPHTKPFRFWEWLIAEVRLTHPEAIFLAEAFTRPKVMAYLAKCGFSQSYSYFTWRTAKSELVSYFTELTQTPVREFMRVNLFANTPDIFHEFLQTGGRAAYQIRLFLAATLGATYGIYGPVFELCESRGVPGTEDYLDSEKYQVRVWDFDKPGHIKEWIKLVNTIRRANPALQADHRLRFLETTSDQIIAYVKTTRDLSNIILTVINLDPQRAQEAHVRLPLELFDLSPEVSYQMHDLLSDARFTWRGESNYVRLDPAVCPAHIFRLRRKMKTERDFDYFG